MENITISLKWIIFGVFTAAFIIGMIIHISIEGYIGEWTGGKYRGQLGIWGIIMIILYLIFLAIYGGVYWW